MLLGILLHGMMSFIALPITVSSTQDIYQDSPFYGWALSAIHGFRMPLFFLVSGMFTALLWQRRGSGGLIKHRMVRIGIPLLIGSLTIVPAVFAINIFKGRNIWAAASQGDSSYVQSYAMAGRDIEARLNAEMLPGHGGTPLHIAAASTQCSIAEQLLGAGADVNAPASNLVDGQPSRATPLHWAAFSKDPRMIQLLLDHGAEVNLKDISGLTALDYTDQNAKETVAALLAAGALRGEEIDAAPSNALADEQGAASVVDAQTAGQQVDYLGDWIRRSPVWVQLFALTAFFPVFVHLWFLWYLLWLVAAFVAVAWMARRFQWKPLPTWMFQFPAMWFWVWPPTVALQLVMVQSFGPDTASGFVPWPPTLIYYSLFFGFGALYQCRPQTEFRLGNNFLRCLVLGLAILPLGLYAVESRHLGFWLYQGIASLVAATYVWLLILGLFGLFRRLCAGENPTVRYVSDASYWIYLMHLPIVQLLQAWMCDWQIASPLKLSMIVTITFAVTLVSYELFVRYTWIGAILHGRKFRQAKPTPVAARQVGLQNVS